MKNNVKSKLNSLERWEVNILARKFGIIEDGNLFAIYYKHLYSKAKLVKKIMGKKNRSRVKEFLHVNNRLKKLDEDELEDLTRQLGIKEIASDKKSTLIKNILNNTEFGDIPEKLDSKRILLTRGMGLVIFIFLIEVFVKEGAFETILGWLGCMASIIGFFPIPIEELSLKRRIVKWWTIKRLDMIAVLLFFMLSQYPDPLPLLGLVASVASIFGVGFNFFLPDLYREHFYSVCNGIIIVLIMGLIYILLFVISGTVRYDNGTLVKSAKVELLKPLAIKAKDKNEEGSFETDSDGNFIFHLPLLIIHEIDTKKKEENFILSFFKKISPVRILSYRTLVFEVTDGKRLFKRERNVNSLLNDMKNIDISIEKYSLEDKVWKYHNDKNKNPFHFKLFIFKKDNTVVVPTDLENEIVKGRWGYSGENAIDISLSIFSGTDEKELGYGKGEINIADKIIIVKWTCLIDDGCNNLKSFELKFPKDVPSK